MELDGAVNRGGRQQMQTQPARMSSKHAAFIDTRLGRLACKCPFVGYQYRQAQSGGGWSRRRLERLPGQRQAGVVEQSARVCRGCAVDDAEQAFGGGLGRRGRMGCIAKRR
jgi:hypothetical protein